MEEEIVKQLLDRYENAIATYSKFKDRIERHENELRASNQIIQSLKADKEFLKTQIDELRNKLNKLNK
jgi:predicted nuclease with TOPRIM domain